MTARRVSLPAFQTSLARVLTYAGVPVAITACGAVGAFGFANGGYFPVNDRQKDAYLLALVATALTLGISVELGVLDAVFLGALAGLIGWTALSLLWTVGVPDTVLEVERGVVYLAAAAAGVLLLRRASTLLMLLGLWLALVVLATYGLLTRLFPDQLGSFDPISGYRLSDPVGYWNALGILATVGGLLALGLAARSGPLVRCLTAGSTVIFVLAVYFTYSRGSWIAFFAGLAVAIALDPRRVVVITTGLVLAPISDLVLPATMALLTASAWLTVLQRILFVRKQLGTR